MIHSPSLPSRLAWAALCAALLVISPALAQERPAPGGGPARSDPLQAFVKRIDFKGLPADEALRFLSEVAGLNVVTTPDAGQTELTVLLQDVTVKEALETICKLYGLWYRREGRVVRVMTTDEYQKGLTIVREPQTKVFSMLHPNAVSVAVAISDLLGSRVRLSLGVGTGSQGGLGQGGLGQGGFGLGGGSLAGGGGLGSSSGVGPGVLGSGSSGFTNSFGGGSGFGGSGFGGSGFGGSGFGGGGGRDDRSQRLSRDLTAERLARLEEREGRVTGGDVDAATDARPIIAVTVNQRHNLLVVRTADAEALEEIERLVLELDRPTAQVLLEVKILEVKLGDDFQSVFDVNWTDGPVQNPAPPGQPVNPFVSGAATVLQQAGSAANLPLSGGTLIYQYLNDHVRLRLQLMARENRLAVLATPLLLCANSESASIFVGEQRPLVRSVNVQTSNNGVSGFFTVVEPEVDVTNIGNTLTVVPNINADRSVTLTILQDISSVNLGGAALPVSNGNGGISTFSVDTVNTANLQATVVAKDGMTLAIGGLIRKEMVDRQEGIPYLMDLPLIGWLFGETVRAESQRELILLITPHVLMTPAEGAARSRARMRALSLHPYHDLGDRALSRYERDDVPGSEGYGLLVEDYLVPMPEPEAGE